MILRSYKPSDCTILAKIFYDTVHEVNAADYSEQQLNSWATGEVDLEQWNESFLNSCTVVAERDGIIVGFGNMTDDGYFDKLFIHKDYQRQGIASSICDIIEKYRRTGKIYSYVSINAKPFFTNRGYCEIKENCAERNGTYLINYLMEKTVSAETGEEMLIKKVREFKETDIDEVMEIWLEANKQAHSFISAEYWESNASIVRKLLPKAEVYICESAAERSVLPLTAEPETGMICGCKNESEMGNVLGFIGLNGVHIEGLFVCRRHRSKGIGKTLLDYAKEKKQKLTLNVYSKNSAALRFYEREGFSICGKSIDDTSGEENLFMEWRK